MVVVLVAVVALRVCETDADEVGKLGTNMEGLTDDAELEAGWIDGMPG